MIFPKHREPPPVLPDGLPADVARVARFLPAVAALAVLTGRDSPRWAYGCWALDLVGPLRSQPRMRPEDHEAIQRHVNEISTLTDLVRHLDSLADAQTAPERPDDAPLGLLTSRALRWPVLRREIYTYSQDPVLAGLRGKVQATERLAVGPAWGGDPEIFTNTVGHVTDPAWITKRFRTLSREAGLPTIRLHDARHTAASQWLAAGVPLKDVSGLLGHSSISITADTYGHVLDDSRQAAARAMASRLDG